MQRRKITSRISSGNNGRKDRGFTLVELIVVLAILAILAAAGTFAAVGYIRRSKFDQNNQNAITVYQTAQAAMSRMVSDGTMDKWTRDLMDLKDAEGKSLFNVFSAESINKLEEDKVEDQSIHNRIALTYNPQSADSAGDSYLYNMLSDYFYDKTVFAGTISLELDIAATYGSGRVNYSTIVLSSFYSRENTATSGWDANCIGDNGYNDEFPMLPDVSEDHRKTKSLVGWFNGTAESVSLPLGLSPVYLPQAAALPLDGHIVAGNETGYLFNLRNSETLDLAWAIFDEAGDPHEYHNENLIFTLRSAGEGNQNNESGYGNVPNDSSFYDQVQIKIAPDKLQSFLNSVGSSSSSVTYERISVYDITRTSREGFIEADVVRTEGGKEVTHTAVRFPLTITKVEGDGRTGTPRDSNGFVAPYYEFRLTLDGMMERADETSISGNSSTASFRWRHFSIDRLFGYSFDGTEKMDHATPRNFYATMLGSWEYISANYTTQTHTIEPTKPTEAARAMDDPVYLTNVDIKNGRLTYFYTILEGLGRFDGADSEDEVTGNSITGRCVVNSLFGDYVFEQGNDKAASEMISGTYWTSSGGNAVITSYRHLYNIRKIDQNKTAAFRIVRNIDWYVHDTGKVDDATKEFYASEVRVFSVTSTPKRYSPVVNEELKVVSFPAIQKIYAKHTLTSMSSASGKACSINNVQMRVASFRNNSDNGYGLICQNYGTVYNIYTNNLNLIIANVADGSASDYKGGNSQTSICPENPVDFAVGGSVLLDKNKDKSVGGLIGRNSGKLGLSPDTPEDVNTINMRNAVVMGGQYWKAADYSRTSGVIGYYDASSSSSGVIELSGVCAVVGGGSNVAGVLGDVKADVGARLVVDGTVNAESSEIELPVSSVTDERMTFVLSGPRLVAGGIAWIENSALYYGTPFDTSDITYEQSTGRMTFPGRNNDFQIDVTIPSDGLIIKFGENQDDPPAGAISNWNKCKGDFANIRVHNYGNIVTSSTTKNVSVGAAVGVEVDSKVSNVYIEAVNYTGSRVGSVNDIGSICAGGAYGWIQDKGSFSAGRTITINAANNGTIISRGKGNGQGSGGAIGGANDRFQARLVIDVYNGDSSRIIGTGSNATNGTGVGGAIGGLGNSDNNNVCQIPADSRIFVENRGELVGNYNVGGAIGNSSLLRGRVYTLNSGTISGTDYVGGAIGRLSYAYYGYIQSILDGAEIIGNNFIGGAAGRLLSFQDNASAKVIVRDDSSVEGSKSIVGGVCGDVRVQGNGGIGGEITLSGNSSAPVLEVRGGDSSADECIGGVVGILRSTVDNYMTVTGPDQSATNKLIIEVDGGSSVGGVIGKLRASNKESTVPYEISNQNYVQKNINVDVSTVLHPQSHVYGSDSYVGGAVGFLESNNGLLLGNISVSSSVGSSDGGSYISGLTFVGGAIGRLGKTCPKDDADGSVGSITIDFSASPWTIEGTGTDETTGYTNVGGAVGCFDNYASNKEQYTTTGWANRFPITVNLGASDVIGEGKNVGGAIGWNLIRNGAISVTMSGTVSGRGNVGGAIGSNRANLYTVDVNISGIGHIIGGEESDIDPTPELVNTTDFDGTNVGGAIGFNHSAIAKDLEVSIGGEVFGYGNNVGGAIGMCYATNNKHRVDGADVVLWIDNIDVTLRGSARVWSSSNSVGGALGYTLGSINKLRVNITGASHVQGNWRVGGAIGLASGIRKTDNSSDKNGAGVIRECTAVVSADNALIGIKKVGGVVGQSSAKFSTNADEWTYAIIMKLTGIINTSTLFDPEKTGPDSPYEDAQVGGIVGFVADGTLEDVILSGSGGTVHVDYPYHTYTNTILVSAKGRSVGGIAGQIGAEGLHEQAFIAHVTIGAESGTPDLCVVSVNGADRIGGWFGSGFGRGGGLGNRTTVTTYEVDNVKVVYSTGSSVGGLMGYINLDHSNANEWNIYANAHVTLDEASIIGRSEVGGAVGNITSARWTSGEVTVSLNNHTNIGDLAGNAMPGDNTSYSPLCYEAGGAFGLAYGRSERMFELNVPVTVTIDATSRIAGLAESTDSTLAFADAGVGGAIGRFYGTAHNGALVKVIAEDLNVVSVCSAHSNVGGCIGVMEGGEFTNNKSSSFDNQDSARVSVRGDGDDICVGGFIGRMDSDKSYGVMNCNSSGTVLSTGQRTWTGGFVGYMRSGKITYSFTTAEVRSNGSCTGGFIGGTGSSGDMYVENNYVGGHTYEGQYLAGEGNITGIGNVGGFIGMIGGNVQIKTCYSTASVLGTKANVGGFVGNYAVDNGFIDYCYCTGRVSGPEVANEDGTTRPADTVGSFAGFTKALNGTRFKNTNRVMTTINRGNMNLVGSVDGVTGATPGNNQIIASDQSAIHSGSPVAYPYDSSLLTYPNSDSSAFPLRAVINSEHYGDWPNPVTGGHDLAEAIITLAVTEYVYDPAGVSVRDNLTVQFGGELLEEGTDYTLSYVNNDRAGTARVIVSAKAGSGFTGSQSLIFTITRAVISGENTVVDMPYKEYEFTGAPITPDNITVSFGGRTLVQNTDYYLTYARLDVSEFDVLDHKSLGTISVSVHGLENYQGDIADVGTFGIKGCNLENAEVTLTNSSSLVYTGEEIRPGVVVREGGRTLVENEDYELEYENNIEAGTNSASVIVTGKGSYSGTITKEFSILQATNRWITNLSIDDWTYGEESNAPVGETAFGELVFTYYKNEDCTLPAVGDDPTTVPSDAETYWLRAYVVATSNYTGIEQRVKFTINKADISQASVTVESDVYKYTGEPIKPESITVVYLENTLEEGKDYIISYPDNITDAGIITFAVNGIGNYTNTLNGTYVIDYYYIVTFNSQGGSDVEPQEIRNGGYAAEPETVPTKDGFVFDCWCTDTAGNYPFVFDETTITQNTTLYAKWIPLYTVSFETGDDDVTVESQIIQENDTVVQPDDPEWVGHEFVGWCSDAECIEAYDFSAPVRSDLVIYAKWITLKSVSFETGNPEITFDTQYLHENETAVQPDDPEWAGHEFDGWFSDAEYSEEYDFSTPVTDDLVIYAKWINLYSVSFNFLNGDITIDSLILRENESVDRPEDPVWDGHVLSGWFTDQECTEEYDFSEEVTADVVLYAEWFPSFTVSFETGDADALVASQNVKENEPATRPEDPEWEGHVFSGWYIDPEYTEAYDFARPVTKDIILYAKWD